MTSSLARITKLLGDVFAGWTAPSVGMHDSRESSDDGGEVGGCGVDVDGGKAEAIVQKGQESGG
jgi:hypothetical protein